MKNIYLGLNCESIDNKLASEFEGVGLIRSEYLCRNIEEYITEESCRKYIYDYVSDICKKFSKKEVWYRFTDLTTNEINTLKGCDHYINEKYHFMGTKGVRRHLLDINTFKLEAKLISKLSKNNDNLGVIIPYISSVEQFIKIKEILYEVGYIGKIGIMVEIPITVFLIDEFISEGAEMFVVGMNDLTTNMLSGTRESIYHDKNNLELLKIIKTLKKKCNQRKKGFMVAGYFNKDNIKTLKKIKDLKIVINYANLPNLNAKYNKLEELNILNEIKKRTKEKRKILREERP